MLDNKGLYDSVQLGALTLSDRVFMAPLTRNRAEQTACRDQWRQPIRSSALWRA
jgi:2,4-dienoyl-CoA reductase-like NADH-dependent reductase (Old Yellow Enzyme family)